MNEDSVHLKSEMLNELFAFFGDFKTKFEEATGAELKPVSIDGDMVRG